MSERDAILARVRSATGRLVPHPGAYHAPPSAADWDAFADALRAAGGEPLGPLPRASLAPELERRCGAWAAGARVVAAGPAAEVLGPGPWQTLARETDPHTLDDVGVAILWGSVAVAENGAIALHGAHTPARALAFLCDRLVLLVETRALVATLHDAIRALPPDATRHAHYTWISGPSKTADIEQALVLGAHGPRACTVVGIA